MHSGIYDELERIRMENGGILRPADVVNAAKEEKNLLHDCFEWDDSKAAHDHRLWQARELIRVTIRVLPSSEKTVRAYVSLVDDRKKDGGYRSIIDVLTDEELSRRMLEQALHELNSVRRKYHMLKELSDVFNAIDKAQESLFDINGEAALPLNGNGISVRGSLNEAKEKMG